MDAGISYANLRLLPDRESEGDSRRSVRAPYRRPRSRTHVRAGACQGRPRRVVLPAGAGEGSRIRARAVGVPRAALCVGGDKPRAAPDVCEGVRARPTSAVSPRDPSGARTTRMPGVPADSLQQADRRALAAHRLHYGRRKGRTSLDSERATLLRRRDGGDVRAGSAIDHAESPRCPRSIRRGWLARSDRLCDDRISRTRRSPACHV